MSGHHCDGGYVTRSRVIRDGETIAVLPTWSDGSIVEEARPDLVVSYGEWLGVATHSAPEPTHRGAHDFLREVAK